MNLVNCNYFSFQDFPDQDRIQLTKDTIGYWEVFSQQNSCTKQEIQRASLETKKLIYLLEDTSEKTAGRISEEIQKFINSPAYKAFRTKLNTNESGDLIEALQDLKTLAATSTIPKVKQLTKTIDTMTSLDSVKVIGEKQTTVVSSAQKNGTLNEKDLCIWYEGQTQQAMAKTAKTAAGSKEKAIIKAVKQMEETHQPYASIKIQGERLFYIPIDHVVHSWAKYYLQMDEQGDTKLIRCAPRYQTQGEMHTQEFMHAVELKKELSVLQKISIEQENGITVEATRTTLIPKFTLKDLFTSKEELQKNSVLFSSLESIQCCYKEEKPRVNNELDEKLNFYYLDGKSDLKKSEKNKIFQAIADLRKGIPYRSLTINQRVCTLVAIGSLNDREIRCLLIDNESKEKRYLLLSRFALNTQELQYRVEGQKEYSVVQHWILTEKQRPASFSSLSLIKETKIDDFLLEDLMHQVSITLTTTLPKNHS
jgi:hypothetical protein